MFVFKNEPTSDDLLKLEQGLENLLQFQQTMLHIGWEEYNHRDFVRIAEVIWHTNLLIKRYVYKKMADLTQPEPKVVKKQSIKLNNKVKPFDEIPKQPILDDLILED